MIPTFLRFMKEKRAHDSEGTPRRVPGILKVLDKCPISLNFFHHIFPLCKYLRSENFNTLVRLCL